MRKARIKDEDVDRWAALGVGICIGVAAGTLLASTIVTRQLPRLCEARAAAREPLPERAVSWTKVGSHDEAKHCAVWKCVELADHAHEMELEVVRLRAEAMAHGR